MDDHPAEAARLSSRRPPLSVVMPVRNGGLALERALRSLSNSTFRDYELVVVDDGSSDGSGSRAAAHGARVLRFERAQGPAASRNAGAELAAAPLLFFLDADVIVHADTLRKAVERFDRDPELTALFGSYDAWPTAPGLVSQFRNLLHHYVHQQGHFVEDARPAHTFWTGCGAIRRDAFLAVGGFDPRRFRRPAIEDIELGYRLSRAGLRIELVRDVLVTHQKRWTLGSMVRTDVFHRGLPWMLLLMRTHRRENDLNVTISQRVSVAAVGLGSASLVAAPWWPPLATVSLVCAVLVALLNFPFYRYLSKLRGIPFALASFPLHLLYFICCGVSVMLAGMLCLLLAHQPDPALHPPERAISGSHVFPRVRSRKRSRRSWQTSRGRV